MKTPGEPENEFLLRSLERGSPKNWPEPFARGKDLPADVRPDVDATILNAIRKAAQNQVVTDKTLPEKSAYNNKRTWLLAALLPLAIGLFFLLRKNTDMEVQIADSIGTRIEGTVAAERVFNLKQGDAVQLEIPAAGKGIIVVGPADFQIVKNNSEIQFLINQGNITLLSQPQSAGGRIAFLAGSIRLVPIGTAGSLNVNGSNVVLTVTEGEFEAQFPDERKPERIKSGRTWTYSSGQSNQKDASPKETSEVNDRQSGWRNKQPLSESLKPARETAADALTTIRRTYGSIQRVELKDGQIIMGYVDVITRDTMSVITPDGNITVARGNVASMKEY